MAFKNVGVIEKLHVSLVKNPFDDSYFDGWKMDKVSPPYMGNLL